MQFFFNIVSVSMYYDETAGAVIRNQEWFLFYL